MNKPIDHSRPSNENDIVEKKAPITNWILMILAVIYTISPVDIIPDVPVIGWVDDFFALATAAVNLFQSYVGDKKSFMYNFLKYIKYGLIILGIIAVGIVILIVLGIISLFN